MANWFSRLLEKRSNVKFQEVDRTIAAPIVGSFFNPSKTEVNPETAKKVSTYFACIRNISEDTATPKIKILRKDSQGNKTLDNGNIAYKLLNVAPNQFCSPFTFRETIVTEALERGNGYAFIERDDNGFPIALYNLDPISVVPKLVDRKLYYIINDTYLGIYGTFTSQDVFHLRGLGNAYVGTSVLKWASTSLGKSIATQDTASKYFGGGASMTGLLELTNVKDEATARKTKDSFMNSYKTDGIAVIGGATKFTKLDFNADESQLLESQEFNVNDVCRWFRMPLSKVQKSEKIENIEALNIEYVNDCLSSWQIRFEQEVKAKLFTVREKQMLEVVFDNTDLLRGDTEAQERRVKTLFFTGAINSNEVRSYFGMNGIGKDGDRYFNPVNMVPNEFLPAFWESKDNSKADTSSADSSGSGANNNNISQNGN